MQRNNKRQTKNLKFRKKITVFFLIFYVSKYNIRFCLYKVSFFLLSLLFNFWEVIVTRYKNLIGSTVDLFFCRGEEKESKTKSIHKIIFFLAVIFPVALLCQTPPPTLKFNQPQFSSLKWGGGLGCSSGRMVIVKVGKQQFFTMAMLTDNKIVLEIN